MAQKNRSKELWLIPKRGNLHQAVCLIDGILERGYDGTTWNPQKQDNLGVNLKKWGATRSGKNISAQSIRTLAAYMQYLGFLYIDTEAKTNTIRLTKAGKALWDLHHGSLEKIPNLRQEKGKQIRESQIALLQMLKLQLTNPVAAKDCEEIALFPFRFLLQVLLETEYLDKEEIAYILFFAADESEVSDVVEQVRRFRSLSAADRERTIDDFMKTHLGNITLKQASSAGYFIGLCEGTGLVEKFGVRPANRADRIAALRIRKGRETEARELLDVTFANARPYDFEKDLRLWIDYIGDPDRLLPPVDVTLKNTDAAAYLFQVFFQGECRADDLVEAGETMTVPMFPEEEYEVRLTDLGTGAAVGSRVVRPDDACREFELGSGSAAAPAPETPESLADEILEHCDAKMFAGKTLSYLNTLAKVTGRDRTEDKSLRGAYLEYLMYRLLLLLKDAGVVDEVHWNGSVGKYGLPAQAPGGKTGTPDLIFVMDDVHMVLELTTIKPKSLQFSAEGSSVPDHIHLYQESSAYKSSGGKQVAGIFAAPVIHARNTAAMQSTIAPYGIPLHCMEMRELLDLLLTGDRNAIRGKFQASP